MTFRDIIEGMHRKEPAIRGGALAGSDGLAAGEAEFIREGREAVGPWEGVPDPFHRRTEPQCPGEAGARDVREENPGRNPTGCDRGRPGGGGVRYVFPVQPRGGDRNPAPERQGKRGRAGGPPRGGHAFERGGPPRPDRRG